MWHLVYQCFLCCGVSGVVGCFGPQTRTFCRSSFRLKLFGHFRVNSDHRNDASDFCVFLTGVLGNFVGKNLRKGVSKGFENLNHETLLCTQLFRAELSVAEPSKKQFTFCEQDVMMAQQLTALLENAEYITAFCDSKSKLFVMQLSTTVELTKRAHAVTDTVLVSQMRKDQKTQLLKQPL